MPKYEDLADQDLKGRTVLLRSEYYKGEENERLFLCKTGFGCVVYTVGSAIMGEFVHDGEKTRIDRSHIDKVVSEAVSMSWDEFINKILEICPDADLSFDRNGQIHIHTMLRTKDRLIVSIEDEAMKLKEAKKKAKYESVACRNYQEAGCFEDEYGKPIDPKSCWVCGMSKYDHN